MTAEILSTQHSEHAILIREINKKMPDTRRLETLAGLYRAFGDPTRMRILWALSYSELCVNCIAEMMDMTQSAISHQLSFLKQVRLVKFRRDGKTIYYSLNDSHIATILAQGMDHIQELAAD